MCNCKWAELIVEMFENGIPEYCPEACAKLKERHADTTRKLNEKKAEKLRRVLIEERVKLYLLNKEMEARRDEMIKNIRNGATETLEGLEKLVEINKTNEELVTAASNCCESIDTAITCRSSDLDFITDQLENISFCSQNNHSRTRELVSIKLAGSEKITALNNDVRHSFQGMRETTAKRFVDMENEIVKTSEEARDIEQQTAVLMLSNEERQKKVAEMKIVISTKQAEVGAKKARVESLCSVRKQLSNQNAEIEASVAAEQMEKETATDKLKKATAENQLATDQLDADKTALNGLDVEFVAACAKVRSLAEERNNAQAPYTIRLEHAKAAEASLRSEVTDVFFRLAAFENELGPRASWVEEQWKDHIENARSQRLRSDDESSRLISDIAEQSRVLEEETENAANEAAQYQREIDDQIVKYRDRIARALIVSEKYNLEIKETRDRLDNAVVRSGGSVFSDAYKTPMGKAPASTAATLTVLRDDSSDDENEVRQSEPTRVANVLEFTPLKARDNEMTLPKDSMLDFSPLMGTDESLSDVSAMSSLFPASIMKERGERTANEVLNESNGSSTGSDSSASSDSTLPTRPTDISRGESVNSGGSEEGKGSEEMQPGEEDDGDYEDAMDSTLDGTMNDSIWNQM